MEPVTQFGTDHVSDLAVHPSTPEALVVGAVDGSVHRYTEFKREMSWSTKIPNARVCWADSKVVVWGAQKQAMTLGDDGSTISFEIGEQADLVVAGRRLLTASPAAGLVSFQLDSGQPVLREPIRLLEHYRDRSLIASSRGAIALVAAGRILFQPRADAKWQEANRPCRAISFSPDGSALAVLQARRQGMELAIIAVTAEGTLDVDHQIPVFPLLASAATHVGWSMDGSSIFVLATDGELEVRSSRTGQLTFSMQVAGIAHSYPKNNVIITGGPKGLHSYSWGPVLSKLWITRRSGSATPDELEVVAQQDMSRGDEILLFVDDPVLRPAGVYEVINGARSLGNESTPNPIVGTLRVPLPEPAEATIFQERGFIERLANLSPLRDTRVLGTHDAVLQLLGNLYPATSATASQLKSVLGMEDPDFQATVGENSAASAEVGTAAAPAASLHRQLEPLHGLFERYAGVVAFVDLALVARLGAPNEIVSARITATRDRPPEVLDEGNGWIALRTGMPIEAFGDLLSQLSRGAIDVCGRSYSFLIGDNAHFNGFRSQGSGLAPVRPVAHTVCSGGAISAVLKEREFFRWRDHYIPVDSGFFDLQTLIERLQLRQQLQGDGDHRQVHVEFELPLDVELLALTETSFSVSLRIAGHAAKVPVVVKLRNEGSKDTANYAVAVGDEPVRVDWEHDHSVGGRISVRISDSAMLLMDASYQPPRVSDAPISPRGFETAEDLGALPDETLDPRQFADEAARIGASPQVLRLLGSGAEADVYLVRDRFGREVAAKVFYESKRVPEHILAHAVGMARVPHPAVATLYSIETVVDHHGKTVPAILMERLTGEELDQRLRRAVSLDEVISWGRTILEVFEAMHSVDHFHPDPHAGNFFVTDHGLRVYDVLYSLTAEQRSMRTKETLRLANARHVRGLIEALFDKLPMSEAVQVAARMFTTRTRNVDLSLGAIRSAFGDAVESILDQRRTD